MAKLLKNVLHYCGIVYAEFSKRITVARNSCNKAHINTQTAWTLPRHSLCPDSGISVFLLEKCSSFVLTHVIGALWVKVLN